MPPQMAPKKSYRGRTAREMLMMLEVWRQRGDGEFLLASKQELDEIQMQPD